MPFLGNYRRLGTDEPRFFQQRVVFKQPLLHFFKIIISDIIYLVFAAEIQQFALGERQMGLLGRVA